MEGDKACKKAPEDGGVPLCRPPGRGWLSAPLSLWILLAVAAPVIVLLVVASSCARLQCPQPLLRALDLAADSWPGPRQSAGASKLDPCPTLAGPPPPAGGSGGLAAVRDGAAVGESGGAAGTEEQEILSRLQALQARVAREVLLEARDLALFPSLAAWVPPTVLDRMLDEGVDWGAATGEVSKVMFVRAVMLAGTERAGLKVGTLGGSNAYGFGCSPRPACTYVSSLLRLLDLYFKGPASDARNGGVPASGASGAVIALFQLIDPHTDVLVTEFNLNPSSDVEAQMLLLALGNMPTEPALLNTALFSCKHGCPWAAKESCMFSSIPETYYVVDAFAAANVTTLDVGRGVAPFWWGTNFTIFMDPILRKEKYGPIGCEAATCAAERPPGAGAMRNMTQDSLFVSDWHHINNEGHQLVALLLFRALMRTFLSITPEEVPELLMKARARDEKVLRTQSWSGTTGSCLIQKWGLLQTTKCGTLEPQRQDGSWALRRIRADKTILASTTENSWATFQLKSNGPCKLVLLWLKSNWTGPAEVEIDNKVGHLEGGVWGDGAFNTMEGWFFPDVVSTKNPVVNISVVKQGPSQKVGFALIGMFAVPVAMLE